MGRFCAIGGTDAGHILAVSPGKVTVTEDNPVRVIDVFVADLDLSKLGFAGMQPEATGRPAYHPSTMLKIYLYGYLNRVQSRRRLERETQRNRAGTDVANRPLDAGLQNDRQFPQG